MKKSRIYILVILQILISSCSATKTSEDLKQNEVNGDIKILTEKSYSIYKDNSINFFLGSKKEFNKKGNITKEQNIDSTGNIETKSRFRINEYDNNGYLVNELI